MNYKGAEEYIIGKLRDELPENLYYHGLQHTLNVMEAASRYGTMENLGGEEMILLKTAALYHDSGYLIEYSNNESKSVKIVQDVLPAFGYTQNQIVQICEMICSTEVPQKPKNLTEKILCDADLDYLGRDDFYIKGICLLREWNEHGITTSLKEWYVQELHFLRQHKYYTKSAIKLRHKRKMFHLKQVEELLGGND